MSWPAASSARVATSLGLSQLRRRWVTIAGITLLVGALAAASAALVAGSRRSASVVDRFFAAANPYSMEIYVPWLPDTSDLEAIDGIARADLTAYVACLLVTADGTEGEGINAQALSPEAFDPTIRILDGRPPALDAEFEAVVNEAFVRQFGLGVGDDVTVRAFATDQLEEVSAGVYEPRGPTYTFRIVGLARPAPDIARDEVSSPTVSAYSGANAMGVPERFYLRHRAEFLDFGAAHDLIVEPGERERILAAIDAMRPADTDETVFVGPPPFTDRRAALSTPVAMETNALLALGAGVAILGATVVVLMLRLQQRSHEAESATLLALGVTRAQLRAAALVRFLPIAVGGALLAVAGAIALSARFPIGIGRQLEVSTGGDVNVAVLVGAIVAAVAVVLGGALAFGAGRLTTTSSARSARARRLDRLVVASGAPAEATTGAHLFVAGGGVARQAAAAGALATAIVVALTMLAAGITRLYDVPARHGWPWDAALGNVNFSLSPDDVRTLVEHPLVERATVASYSGAAVDGEETEVLALMPRGDAPPTVIAGRLPASAGEIALGRSLAGRIGAAVGSTVTIDFADSAFDSGALAGPAQLRVTGEVLPPPFGEIDPAEMAVVTTDAVAAVGGVAEPQFVLVDVRGDPAESIATIDAEVDVEIITEIVPARFVNLHRIRHLPAIGILVAGALGTVVIAHAVLTTGRRRRAQLAILRALGATRGQLHGILAWFGVTLAGIVLVAGAIVGVLGGMLLWRRVAGDAGAARDAVVTPWLAALVPCVLAVVTLAGLLAVRRSTRRDVGEQLRAQ